MEAHIVIPEDCFYYIYIILYANIFENICTKVMENLLTVILEWVSISKRIYKRNFSYVSHHGIAQQRLLIFRGSQRIAKNCIQVSSQVW